MTDRQHIEKRLQRKSGMSKEALDRMHAATDKLPWQVRCWNCGKIQSILLTDAAPHCTVCSVNLRSRA